MFSHHFTIGIYSVAFCLHFGMAKGFQNASEGAMASNDPYITEERQKCKW